ncbi:MAG: hypothetical protein SBU_001085 [Candidatus Syntrophoarchaeum butanivorans]|uniref:Uncharacterized protein n=1 Tax=Candidatus Syntropharchaeum butanivorans TaxID=1839936 RepID=A0A1F2P414_9EURY|nr:MAG: hypothetical protein SBU_001085 [Candidatus Syntrophoarchaeum butanivorans]
MVEILLKLPEDLKWILKREEDLKFFEEVVVEKMCEMRLEDLLTEKSELKEEEIDALDHLIKKRLFERVKRNWMKLWGYCLKR